MICINNMLYIYIKHNHMSKSSQLQKAITRGVCLLLHKSTWNVIIQHWGNWFTSADDGLFFSICLIIDWNLVL